MNLLTSIASAKKLSDQTEVRAILLKKHKN